MSPETGIPLSVLSSAVEIIVTVVTVTWFVSKQIAALTLVSLENRRIVEHIVAEQRTAMVSELARIQLRLQRLEIKLGLNGAVPPAKSMTDIPLRDYLQAKITALEERTKIQREADQMALQLQAQEYERRLRLLNNEHERLEKQRADTVSREVWDRFQAEYNGWQQSYEVRHAEVVNRRELDQRLKDVFDKMDIQRHEFSVYKEETREQVTLAKGQAKGMMMAWGVMLTLLTIAANILVAYFKR